MASEKILERKKKIVQELVEKINSASTGILVDYKGLTVQEDTELRNELRKAEVEYKVIKNTMLRFAANETNLEDLEPFLHGTTSLAISYDDLIAPAKVLNDFAKKNNKLEIKAGFIEGKIVSIEEIKELAELPSKEVLIAKALGGLNAPITGFVNVLNANLRGLAIALNAIAEQKAQAQ